MKRKLMLEIECGDKTCASEPGVFCDKIYQQPKLKWPQIPMSWCCRLFNVELSEDKPCGWLQRCQACLDAEVKDESNNGLIVPEHGT